MIMEYCQYVKAGWQGSVLAGKPETFYRVSMSSMKHLKREKEDTRCRVTTLR